MGRRAQAVGVFLALLVPVATWPAIDAHARAAALLGQAVLRLPVQPVNWVTPEPTAEEFRWPDGGTGSLTLPGTAGPHPVLVAVLGAEPADPDDPRVMQLRDGLARIGIGLLIVRSGPVIDSAITPDEVAVVVGAFTALERDRRIRDGSIGMLGLSTGGSLMIVAAADPEIADRVWCVFAMGAYHDAGQLVAEVLSGQYRDGSAVVAWTPDETATRVVRGTLLAGLPPADRRAIESGGPVVSAEARTVAELLEGSPTLDRAETLLHALGPDIAGRMAAMSPSAHLPALRAPLYLLHDRSDPFIPVTHGVVMARHDRTRLAYLVDLFAHVEPRPGSLGVLLRDGWRVTRLFAAIIETR